MAEQERRIRLVAVDVDDTLVDDDLRIVKANAEAIRRARREGIAVTLATGRMYASLEHYARELGLDGMPLIAYNGAWVRDLAGREYLHRPLPKVLVLELVRLARELGATLNVYVDDRLYVEEEGEPVEYYMSIAQVEAHRVDDLAAFVGALPEDGGSTKALMVVDEADAAALTDRLQAEYRGRLEIVRSKPRFIEFTAPGVSKGEALRHVAAHLGVEQEEVMAIGDSYNDISMLQYAGIGVAVRNAPPEVQAAADWIVAAHDEGGVAEALERVRTAGERLALRPRP